MAYDESMQQRKAALKAVRSAIRLKHSLAADDEIARKLPELEKDIDRALRSGAAWELDIASVLESA